MDRLRDRGRSDERDRLYVGVVEQRVDGHLVAVDDVEHTVRQPCLLPQLGDEHGRGRVALARLEHERVAAGDRDRMHPHRHHDREVERRDAGDDAERLPEGEQVDAGRDLVGVLALEQVRDAAGELHDLEAALHLARRVRQHLAVLVGDEAGQLRDVRVDELAEREEHLGALAQRCLRPVGECLLGLLHRVVDIAGRGERNVCLLFTGRGVPHRRASIARSAGQLAADPVLDGPHRCCPSSLVPVGAECGADGRRWRRCSTL